MSALTQRLAQSKQNAEIEKLIAQKLATGKFVDTGKKYDANEATADHSNSSLRMTAHVTSDGTLVWSKEN